MAGGCCCSVKRKDSAIIGFAGMNVALFTVLMLICTKEYDAECRRRSEYLNAISDFMHANDWHGHEYNETYPYNENGYVKSYRYTIPMPPYECDALDGLMGFCIFLCVIGIIVGILLIFAVSMKSKGLFLMWTTFQTLIVLILTIIGLVFLIHHYRVSSLDVSISFTRPDGSTSTRTRFRRTSFDDIPYPALFLLSAVPFFIWSLIAVCMSMNGIVSGTVEDEQQVQIYGPNNNQPSFQSPSNQQMLPQNGGYQPQYGNNTVWPQMFQMPVRPDGTLEPLPSAPPANTEYNREIMFTFKDQSIFH